MTLLRRLMQIAFVLGVILLYSAASRFMHEQGFERDAVSGKAEIVDLQDGSARVRFRDKKKNEHFTQISRRKIDDELQETGKHIAIQYLPDEPADSARPISSKPFWFWSLIFFVAGALSLALGFFLRRRIAELEWIAQRIFQGAKIVSNVEQIDLVKGTAKDPSWIITTSWLDQRTLQTRTFRSPPLKLDEDTLDGIKHIRVWLHPDEPQTYLMDLRGIAKRAQRNQEMQKQEQEPDT